MESVIYIKPIGFIDDSILQWLQKDIAHYLHLPVRILNNMPIPAESFDINRNQYYSSEIIKAMIRKTPSDAQKVIGIIDKDISIPILTFVFGEAQLGGKGAVVSCRRLYQEYYDLKPNPQLFLERLHKEALHEMGHTFGLTHCHLWNCLMHFSNNVMEIDKKGGAFCTDCHRSIFSTIEERKTQNG